MIGAGQPVLLVAELSANHRQDFDVAMALVDAAAAAGADAVKLQTYTPDTMTLNLDRPWFKIEDGPWAGRTLYELYREAQMPWAWHAPLQAHAREHGLLFFSTPFDASAVDFLETLDVPAYKIASFELTDTPLLRKVAATGKPVLLSTGMATEAEMVAAVDTLQRAGAGGIVLLKCTSAYPAPPDAANLRALTALGRRFACPVGLSDHSLAPEVAVAAVALGACVVEKHLTLVRKHGGADAGFSLEPDEFGALARAVRTAERALGDGALAPGEAEAQSRMFRRSVFAVEDIRAGEAFTRENIRVLRPAAGLTPDRYEMVLGAHAAVDITAGTPLADGHIAP